MEGNLERNLERNSAIWLSLPLKNLEVFVWGLDDYINIVKSASRHVRWKWRASQDASWALESRKVRSSRRLASCLCLYSILSPPWKFPIRKIFLMGKQVGRTRFRVAGPLGGGSWGWKAGWRNVCTHRGAGCWGWGHRSLEEAAAKVEV